MEGNDPTHTLTHLYSTLAVVLSFLVLGLGLQKLHHEVEACRVQLKQLKGPSSMPMQTSTPLVSIIGIYHHDMTRPLLPMFTNRIGWNGWIFWSMV